MEGYFTYIFLVGLHLVELIAAVGDRFFDDVARQIVRRRAVRLDDADGVPRTKLLGQLVAALVVGKRAQFAIGVRLENKDVHLIFPRGPIRSCRATKAPL